MKRYSQFINFPIHLWASKEFEKEVPAEEDDTEEEETSMLNWPTLLKLRRFLVMPMLMYILYSVS